MGCNAVYSPPKIPPDIKTTSITIILSLEGVSEQAANYVTISFGVPIP